MRRPVAGLKVGSRWRGQGTIFRSWGSEYTKLKIYRHIQGVGLLKIQVSSGQPCTRSGYSWVPQHYDTQVDFATA